MEKVIYFDSHLNLNNTTVDIANSQLYHKVTTSLDCDL